jgi:hypothetical protein
MSYIKKQIIKKQIIKKQIIKKQINKLEDEWEQKLQNIESFIDVRKYTYETLNELYNLNLYDEDAIIDFLYKYSLTT